MCRSLFGVKLKMFIFISTRTIPLPQDHGAHARTCGHKTRCTANINNNTTLDIKVFKGGLAPRTEAEAE